MSPLTCWRGCDQKEWHQRGLTFLRFTSCLLTLLTKRQPGQTNRRRRIRGGAIADPGPALAAISPSVFLIESADREQSIKADRLHRSRLMRAARSQTMPIRLRMKHLNAQPEQSNIRHHQTAIYLTRGGVIESEIKLGLDIRLRRQHHPLDKAKDGEIKDFLSLLFPSFNNLLAAFDPQLPGRFIFDDLPDQVALSDRGSQTLSKRGRTVSIASGRCRCKCCRNVTITRRSPSLPPTADSVVIHNGLSRRNRQGCGPNDIRSGQIRQEQSPYLTFKLRLWQQRQRHSRRVKLSSGSMLCLTSFPYDGLAFFISYFAARAEHPTT